MHLGLDLVAVDARLSWGAVPVRWPADGLLGPVCEVSFEVGPDVPSGQRV